MFRTDAFTPNLAIEPTYFDRRTLLTLPLLPPPQKN
jgi:hypothetical protein